MPEPLFIVLTGAGGVGKTTIRDGLIQVLPDRLVTIQKVTTRARRPGEEQEFRFVSPQEFAAMDARNELFAPTEFGGNSYGTPRALIDRAWQTGKSIVMIYDADGARRVKSAYPSRGVWVFLKATETDLRRRLKERGETHERIEERLRLAPLAESPKTGEADLVVENNDGEKEQAILTIAKAIQSRLG